MIVFFNMFHREKSKSAIKYFFRQRVKNLYDPSK